MAEEKRGRGRPIGATDVNPRGPDPDGPKVKPAKLSPYRPASSFERIRGAIEAGRHYERATECIAGLISIATSDQDLPQDSAVRVSALSSALTGHLKLLAKVLPDARLRPSQMEESENAAIPHESAIEALERAGVFAASAARNGFPVLRSGSGTDTH